MHQKVYINGSYKISKPTSCVHLLRRQLFFKLYVILCFLFIGHRKAERLILPLWHQRRHRRPGRQSPRPVPPDAEHLRVPDHHWRLRPPHCLHDRRGTMLRTAQLQGNYSAGKIVTLLRSNELQTRIKMLYYTNEWKDWTWHMIRGLSCSDISY